MREAERFSTLPSMADQFIISFLQNIEYIENKFNESRKNFKRSIFKRNI